MHATLKCLEAELTGSLIGLSPGDLVVTPHGDSGRWCIQQIVEHLLLSYRSTVEVFEARIAKGTPTRAKVSWMQWLGQMYVIRLGRFPSGRKAPVEVEPTKPFPSCNVEDLIDRVQAGLARLDEVMGRATTLFGDTPAVSHFVLGPMAVEHWRTFHLVHGRHHIDQILAIRQPLERSAGAETAGLFALGKKQNV